MLVMLESAPERRWEDMPATNGAHQRVIDCVTEENIRRLVTGEFDIDERRAIMNEINSCVFCKRRLFVREEKYRPAKNYRHVR